MIALTPDHDKPIHRTSQTDSLTDQPARSMTISTQHQNQIVIQYKRFDFDILEGPAETSALLQI